MTIAGCDGHSLVIVNNSQRDGALTIDDQPSEVVAACSRGEWDFSQGTHWRFGIGDEIADSREWDPVYGEGLVTQAGIIVQPDGMLKVDATDKDGYIDYPEEPRPCDSTREGHHSHPRDHGT